MSCKFITDGVYLYTNNETREVTGGEKWNLAKVFTPKLNTVLLSSCPPILLSSCPQVLLYSCPPVLLSFFPPVISTSCHHVPLSSYTPILLSSCPPVYLSSSPSVLLSVHKYKPSVKTLQLIYARFKENIVSTQYKKIKNMIIINRFKRFCCSS